LHCSSKCVHPLIIITCHKFVMMCVNGGKGGKIWSGFPKCERSTIKCVVACFPSLLSGANWMDVEKRRSAQRNASMNGSGVEWAHGMTNRDLATTLRR
jgi:hypothetical protein